MEGERPSTEILVHITAPSRAVDDIKYRSLASSYNEFRPVRNIPLPLSPTHRIHLGAGQQAATRPACNLNYTQAAELVGSSFGSLQASFSSVLDNANSPGACPPPKGRLQTPVRDSQQPTIHNSAWSTPPSIVQDSLAESPSHLPAFTSPTRLLEHYLHGFGTSPTPSVQTKTTSQRSAGSGFPRGLPSLAEEKEASQQSSHPDCSSTSSNPVSASLVIPCTPSENQLGTGHPSNQAAAASHGKEPVPPTSLVEDCGGDIVEETALVSSGESSLGPLCLARADSEPPPPKRRQLLDTPVELGSPRRPLLRTSSDTSGGVAKEAPLVSAAAASQKLPVAIAFLPSHGYTYESLELHSPDPPTASIPLTLTHQQHDHLSSEEGLVEGDGHFITAGLAKLAADLDITRRFRPQASTRALDPTERGYWHVDCRTWDAALRRDAWAFLANYVGTGVAGWGVWCRRDGDFASIRAYCWGATAPHIYLVLYLASQRRILFTGTDWMDGEGEPVITMGARPG